jgi:hypothetical protein
VSRRVWLVLAIIGLPFEARAQQPSPPSPAAPLDRDAPLAPLRGLTREREIALALASAPAAISDSATVWVTGPKGYEVAQQGSNGWGCLVQRGYAGTVPFPRCDDAERVAAVYPVFHLLEQFRAEGKSARAYEAAVAEGYRRGKYRAPSPGAVSYMYADGALPPHVMISMPHCTIARLGFATPQQMSDATIGVSLLGLGRPNCDLIIFTPPETRRKVAGAAAPTAPPAGR